MISEYEKLFPPKQIKQESVQLNYNCEKNKYYLINNENGEEIYIQNTGEQVKKFNASLTGQANYQERIAKAKNKQEMPYRAKSLQIAPEKMFYTPKLDKFYNYAQNPNEIVQPYHNELTQHLITNKEKIKGKVEKIQQNKLFRNKYNQKILQSKNQLSNLTGTLCDKKFNEDTNQLKLLKHRNETKTLPLHEYEHLKATKIINGIISKQPNETFLRTQLQKIKMVTEGQESASQQYEAKFLEAEQQFNNKISNKRFTNKSRSPSNSTLLFPPKRTKTFQSDKNEINNYYKKHQSFHRTPSQLLPLVTQFTTTTFPKQIILGYNKELRPDTVIGLHQFKKDLERQKMELQNWQQVEKKQEQKRIPTKNRFNSAIPDCAKFNLGDRKLYQTFFPQPVEKTKKNKRLFIDPITGKTLVNQPKVAKSASTTNLHTHE